MWWRFQLVSLVGTVTFAIWLKGVMDRARTGLVRVVVRKAE
jgi:hypothetical protein